MSDPLWYPPGATVSSHRVAAFKWVSQGTAGGRPKAPPNERKPGVERGPPSSSTPPPPPTQAPSQVLQDVSGAFGGAKRSLGPVLCPSWSPHLLGPSPLRACTGCRTCPPPIPLPPPPPHAPMEVLAGLNPRTVLPRHPPPPLLQSGCITHSAGLPIAPPTADCPGGTVPSNGIVL